MKGKSFPLTSDSGAQVTIMGEDHIRHIGLNRNCLLSTKIKLDCANASKAECLGAFMVLIRGSTFYGSGDAYANCGLIYVISGAAILLSETACKDL